ncbi:MAG: hypothetical protein WKG07_17440 [Hymenobacter sp.]
MPDTPPAARAPAWVQSSTAGAGGYGRPYPPPAPEPRRRPRRWRRRRLPATPTPLPTVGSPDGRFVLTDGTLTVMGQSFGLRELERAEVRPVRWLLWYLLGGLGLAVVLILFLNNWLRTLPTMGGLLAAALLLAVRPPGHQPAAPGAAGARSGSLRAARRCGYLAAPGARAEPPRWPGPRPGCGRSGGALLAALEALPPAEPPVDVAIPDLPA